MKICVFVSASNDIDEKYKNCIIEFGKELVAKNIELVYGGANIGLMGLLAKSVLDAGGMVTGIIPKQLLPDEIAHPRLSKLLITDSIQERKKKMAELADAFIVLPGGIGTLDEVFEVWNAIKINLFNKPLGFLNVDGYFDLLIAFLRNSINEGFIKTKHLDIAHLSNSSFSLLSSICDTMKTNIENNIVFAVAK